MTSRSHGTRDPHAVRFFSVALLGAAVLYALAGCESDKRPTDKTEPETPAATPQHYLEGGGGKGEFKVAATLAPKPTEPLPEGAACVTSECHPVMATARHIHGPIGKGACTPCHTEDVGDHHYPLMREGNSLCSFCHASPVPGPALHKGMKSGCQGCHRPHTSEAKFLLKAATVDRLCLSCHKIRWQRYTHSVVATGQCTLCHQPHESPNKFLLIGGDGPKQCFTCHDGIREAVADLPHVHKPVKTNCGECHDAHASPYKYQLHKPLVEGCLACHKKLTKRLAEAQFRHGATKQTDGCANCHDAHASWEPALQRQRMDNSCLQCHNKAIATSTGRTIKNMEPVLRESKYLHGPVRQGDCSACHDPHASNRVSLLKADFAETFYARFDVDQYDLCFRCHSKQLVLRETTANLTGFRNGKENLHYVHVHRERRGRTCRTCHKIHGSNLPRHMASEVPFAGSQWPVPIGFEKTGSGGSCAPGCHAPRAYDRVKPQTYPRSPAAETQPAQRGAL